LDEVRVLKMVNGTDKGFKGVVVTCFKEILTFPFRETRGKPLKQQSHDLTVHIPKIRSNVT